MNTLNLSAPETDQRTALNLSGADTDQATAIGLTAPAAAKPEKPAAAKKPARKKGGRK